MIRVDNVYKTFGGLKAVDGVSLELKEGSITGLIGPNGAGKTTLFNIIAGKFPLDSGQIWLKNENVTGLSPHELFDKGILRTFQIAQEFYSLTVIENLMVVPNNQTGESLFGACFRSGLVKKEESEIRDRASDVLEFLNLSDLAYEKAGNLSGGQKKLLELGRTMMVEPKIVFLDEVGAGVNRTLLRSIGDAIYKLNKERNYTFCMIEHDMDFITRLCEPVIVMAEGKILMQGSALQVQSDERVIEAYLGTGFKNISTVIP